MFSWSHELSTSGKRRGAVRVSAGAAFCVGIPGQDGEALSAPSRVSEDRSTAALGYLKEREAMSASDDVVVVGPERIE